jgi:hypothetical protein
LSSSADLPPAALLDKPAVAPSTQLVPASPPGSGQAATAAVSTKFEFGRLQSGADLVLPIAVLLLLLLAVRSMYRRDAAELPRWLSWLLTLLRAAAFAGLLLFYLQPQWRSERQVVHPSRVVLLIDTSMSMNRDDAEPPAGSRRAAAATSAGAAAPAAGRVTRLAQVAAGLDDTDFLAALRKTHDVALFSFNNALDRDRAVELKKIPAGATDPNSPLPLGEGQGVRAEATTADTPPPPWRKLLVPAGTETRLGEALEQLIGQERNSPISGVVLVSDGGQNAGASPEAAVESAREARIPVFTVGVGSERKPRSVRIYDFKVPLRAYPGDRYTVTGFVQGQGLAGQTVAVELLAREGPEAKDPRERGKGRRVAGQSIVLGGDGEVLPLKFELTPEKTGRQTLCLRVRPPAGDLDPRDKYQEAEVEIVDHKNHVLLLAGGPARDYQFLRPLLFRDRSTTLDVLLQSAESGISQEAQRILDAFPARPEEMAAYDCVVAIDPHWQSLRPGQVELLENWVGDQGGGLIVTAGPVYLGRSTEGWLRDPEMAKIRGLYPVEFHRYVSASGGTAYAAKEPWPLEFTRAGLEAEYLWLGDSAVASQQAWTAFPGVFGFWPVRGPKPGATVLARFSDPRTAQDGQQPVYFAEQFYGSGRVFYMGSGEMWRLRGVDPSNFEQFYTKLIRHVSQGRLLRQSSRGVLLVGQERYLVGSTVDVRAQLSNSKLQPLAAPAVTLRVSRNGAAEKPVTLRADTGRAGTYLGQFQALQEGEYQLDLTIPEGLEEHLTRSIRVVIPKLEEENPQRNAALLGEIAAKTGAVYFANLADALRSGSGQGLVDRLPDASRVESVPVAPKPEWEETWLRWLMIGLCTALCLEWLVRRLVKLA